MADMDDYPVQEQEEQPGKNGNRPVIYIITIVVLASLSGYLYLNGHHAQQQLTGQNQALNEDSIHIADLSARYHMEMDSLYSYKGQNATLDSLLNIKINQLAGMEKSLAMAQRTNKLDEAQYQKNIDTLNTMSATMKAQIADLQKQNGVLVSKNDSLGSSLMVSDSNNQQLTTENTTLGTKLTKASLLVPMNILGEGVKVNSSGKEIKTSNDKKVKRIKVGFDIPANNTIDAGDKTFYLVLTDPKGTILTDDSQGAGVFTTAESQTQQQYTASKTVSFNQQKMHVDIEWNTTQELAPGMYTAEIFQDGYLTGKGMIKLR